MNGFITRLNEEITNASETYKNSGFSKDSLKDLPFSTTVIVGFDKFQAKLDPDNKKLFGTVFQNGKDLGKYSFILVDAVDKFKKVEYDDWYRECVVNNRGLWVGDGIANQFAIKLTKTTKELYEEVGSKFGYAVERGIPTLIKLLEDDKGDDSNEE